ncbi:MAG TPA: hypothetical protein GX505_10250 [Clostridiales bacterium]|nr:hypothetical protein [Clostridiales bacterium]
MDISGVLDETSKEKILPALKHTDIFLPSDYQAKFLIGMERADDMADALLEQGHSVSKFIISL